MSYPYQPSYYPYQQQMMPQSMTQNTQQSYQSQMPQQAFQQQPMQQLQPQQTTPIQNGGFAVVRSEQEARDYLLAPGTFMTFKNENSQYMYEKSRTFSQLDAPIFKKFRLVEEEDTPMQEEVQTTNEPVTKFALEQDFEVLNTEVQSLKKEIEKLREIMNKRTVRPRKEIIDDNEQ